MDIANNFHDLAKNYANWFIQSLQIALNSGLVDEKMFKTKKAVKKGALDLFRRMISFRFALAPNDEAEKYLEEMHSEYGFRYGAVGFLLDLLWTEADESSEEQLPCHLHMMPEKLPESFKVFIMEMSHIIFQSLVESECPDVLIFGELHLDKSFLKKMDDDYSSAIEYFAKKYCSEYYD